MWMARLCFWEAMIGMDRVATSAGVDEYWTLPVVNEGLRRPAECAAWRLRRWLEWYPELEAATYLSCSVEATEGNAQSSGATTRPMCADAPWTNLVCIKADVDRCLRILPRFERFIVGLRYLEERPVADVAGIARCGNATVLRASDRAVRWMAAHLCGAPWKKDARMRNEIERQSSIPCGGR